MESILLSSCNKHQVVPHGNMVWWFLWYFHIFHCISGHRKGMVFNCIAVGCTNWRGNKPCLMFLWMKEAEALIINISTVRYGTACTNVSPLFCLTVKVFPWGMWYHCKTSIDSTILLFEGYSDSHTRVAWLQKLTNFVALFPTWSRIFPMHICMYITNIQSLRKIGYTYTSGSDCSTVWDISQAWCNCIKFKTAPLWSPPWLLYISVTIQYCR